MKKSYFFILISIGLSMIAPTIHAVAQTAAPRITVWIHGTQIEKVLPSFMLSLFKKDIAFLQNSIPGLVHITTVPSSLYVKTIAQSLYDSSPDLFPLDHFYQFGWSGDASVDIRREAGHELYNELKTLYTYYCKTYGCAPVITLMSHSHGGNVVLHMHEYALLDSSALVIDRLVLLACPIQAETSGYVESPLFKSILNIYSHADWIQTVDPQGLHPFIPFLKDMNKKTLAKAWSTAKTRPFKSQRTIKRFPHTKNIAVSWIGKTPWDECKPYISKEHLRFVKMLNTEGTIAGFFSSNHGLSHMEIEFPFFLKHMPDIISYADNVQSDHTSTVTLGAKLLVDIH